MKNLLIKIDEFLGKVFGNFGIIDNIRYSIKPPKLIEIFNEELNSKNLKVSYEIEQEIIWTRYYENQINENELKTALEELNTETMKRMLK
tara:strand:+ start:513 stop:782 length:270 start_codon:yes stop_codon:yes gene_type:complete